MFSGSWWKNARNAASPERSDTQRGWTISCSYLLPWRQQQTKVKKETGPLTDLVTLSIMREWSSSHPCGLFVGTEWFIAMWQIKPMNSSGESYLFWFSLKEILNTHQFVALPSLIIFLGKKESTWILLASFQTDFFSDHGTTIKCHRWGMYQ